MFAFNCFHVYHRIGAVQYLWSRLRCPIYATSFSASLLRHRLGDLYDEIDMRIIPTNVEFSVKLWEKNI